MRTVLNRFLTAIALALFSAAGLTAASARQSQMSDVVQFCLVSCAGTTGCERANCMRTCLAAQPPKNPCQAR